MLGKADDQPANNIDCQNQNAGNSITFNKFRCTIHGAIKIGFFGDVVTAFFGLFVGQHASIQIGINRHLFAGHGVERKAGGYFRYPASAFGNHQKIDDHQNNEDKNTHSIIAGDDKFAKGFDHFTSRGGAFMPFAQDNSGRRHI